MLIRTLAALLGTGVVASCGTPRATTGLPDLFLDTLQQRTIAWFLAVTPEETGLTPDRWPPSAPSSIAAVGFSLTVNPVAVERGMITRAVAARRTLATLRFLWRAPQGDAREGTAGYRGLYYHFVDQKTGLRTWSSELSTIDTGLLMAGVLFSQSYFDGPGPEERHIRQLADSLYRRVDWTWAMGATQGVAMGWTPEEGFHPWIWHGYNEAMILYLLALGSPTHPIPSTAWDSWTATYVWATHYGEEHLNFMSLFGHQYSHVWIDFRGIQDAYMRGKGIDYFENSRRATLLHQTYGRLNPGRWAGYADSIWGWTACDGPKDTAFTVNGVQRTFRAYSARGTAADEQVDDGTIAPTAAAGSVPFAPEVCTRALKAMRATYGGDIWTEYGFVDAFNPTFITETTPRGWFDKDFLGIDQGPIPLMIENARNGFVWEIMKRNPYVLAGLRKAGFSGGWLDTVPSPIPGR
jgi:hypothetical protein